MSTRPPIRRRPARATEAEPAPSNVVQLRPNLSPTPANLRFVATEKRPKNASDDRGLQQPVSAFQVIDEADLSPPANANPSTMTRAEFRKHIAGMTKMQLRKRFKLEANSHRDIIARCKGRRFVLHPEFRDFGRFLWYVGPRPVMDWTIDRTDPENPEYGPGLCRWASPRTQANNRTTTVRLTNEAGETRPLTDWARKTGQKAKTIAKRRERGASDVEAIRGRRAEDEPAPSPPPDATPLVDGWPDGVTVAMWETAFAACVAQLGQHAAPGMTRPVFFAWIGGNRLRCTRGRLARRYPGFDDPDGTEPPAARLDPEFAAVTAYSDRVTEARRIAWTDRQTTETLRALAARWPNVEDPSRAALAIRAAQTARDDSAW